MRKPEIKLWIDGKEVEVEDFEIRVSWWTPEEKYVGRRLGESSLGPGIPQEDEGGRLVTRIEIGYGVPDTTSKIRVCGNS